jgi:ATPase subunit of ABC transporter with duplicated ATPase domains
MTRTRHRSGALPAEDLRGPVTSTDGRTADYTPCLMIRLDNISKQHGHQILFIDASMGLQKGEKVGLVGPNGAGKTTVFRMIAGEDQPDDGQVSVEAGMTIGYFSQDVGEMAGQSARKALHETIKEKVVSSISSFTRQA